MMMHWWYGGGAGVWGYLLMAVSMTVFWCLVIVLIVAVVRGLSGSRQRAGRPAAPYQSPEEILAERFARGEISQQEYREGLAVLRDRPHSSPAR